MNNWRYSELLFNLEEVGYSDWETRRHKKVIVGNEANSDKVFHLVMERLIKAR